MRGPLTLLRDTSALMQAHTGLFIGIYVIPTILAIAAGLFLGDENNPGQLFSKMVSENARAPIAGVLSVVILLADILAALASLYAIMHVKGADIRSSYRYALAHFWPLVWIGILSGIVIVLGFFLLIIPGIIFMVWFAFGQYLFVDKGTRGVDALKVSRALVKGRWWEVFGRQVLISACVILTYALIGALSALTPRSDVVFDVLSNCLNAVVAPFAMIYMYGVYTDLRVSAPVAARDAAPFHDAV